MLLSERIGWTLVHFLWQGAAAAAALALLLVLMRRASAVSRYRVACGALVFMTLAPAATFRLTLREGDQIHPVGAGSGQPGVVSPLRIAAGETSLAVAAAVPVPAQPPPREDALAWLAASWAAGVAALSLWRLAGWARLRRLMRETEAAPLAWQASLARLVRMLGVTRPVRLARASWVAVPSVVGVMRPVVLFPAAALTGLTPAQLEALLAHELAHVRRCDYVVNLLQVFVETLLFYHPGVWWVSARVREEREHCCDDLAAAACGDRADYAAALAAMEELRSLPSSLALAATGAGGSRGALVRRVRRVLGMGPAAVARRSLAAACAACVALPLAAAALLAGAGEPGKPAVTPGGPATREGAGAPKAPAAIDWNKVPLSEINPDDLETQETEYVIAPNDLLSVTLADLEPGTETMVMKRVTAEGIIKLPLLPPDPSIRAAGRTQRQLEQAIDAAYRAADAKRAKPVRVSVTVTEARGRTVRVLGSVKRPGEYAIAQTDFRILDALVLAAGDLGDIEGILVLRPLPQPRKIDVRGERLRQGDAGANVVIRPGDLLIVTAGPLRLARLEVGAKGKLRFRDEATTWAELPALIDKIAASERTHTRLIVQAVSKEVTLQEYNDAIRKASQLAEEHGFRHLTTAEPVNLFPKQVEPPVEQLIGEYYVGGDVEHPGAYSVIRRRITLRQAIVAAGISKEVPPGTTVRVLRRTSEGPDVIERDAAPLLSEEKKGDLPLRPDDQIMVRNPPAGTGKAGE
jgi:protein involved in polysaccharide export with SLBB domain/beta-lactamase regulating signal transducer with metallopeptidase domain